MTSPRRGCRWKTQLQAARLVFGRQHWTIFKRLLMKRLGPLTSSPSDDLLLLLHKPARVELGRERRHDEACDSSCRQAAEERLAH